MQIDLILNSASSCFGWVLAIVVLVIGAVTIRKAESRAGLLVIGAGAVWLLESCCASASEAYLATQEYSSSAGTLFMVSGFFTFLFFAVGVAAVLGAAVVLTRAIAALPSPGGQT